MTPLKLYREWPIDEYDFSARMKILGTSVNAEEWNGNPPRTAKMRLSARWEATGPVIEYGEIEVYAGGFDQFVGNNGTVLTAKIWPAVDFNAAGLQIVE